MARARKMLTWRRVKAAALAVLLSANEQGPPCGHRPALAANHRPQLHMHHRSAEVYAHSSCKPPTAEVRQMHRKKTAGVPPLSPAYRLYGWCCTRHLMEKDLKGAS